MTTYYYNQDTEVVAPQPLQYRAIERSGVVYFEPCFEEEQTSDDYGDSWPSEEHEQYPEYPANPYGEEQHGSNDEYDARWSAQQQEEYSHYPNEFHPQNGMEETLVNDHNDAIFYESQEQNEWQSQHSPTPLVEDFAENDHNDYDAFYHESEHQERTHFQAEHFVEQIPEGIINSPSELPLREVLDLDAQTIENNGTMFNDEYSALMNSLHDQRKNWNQSETDAHFMKINKQRNSCLARDTLELHYLTPPLARDVLRMREDEIKQGVRPNILYVCVGRGKGSKDGKAILREETIRFAEKNGYQWWHLLKNKGVVVIKFHFE